MRVELIEGEELEPMLRVETLAGVGAAAGPLREKAGLRSALGVGYARRR